MVNHEKFKFSQFLFVTAVKSKQKDKIKNMYFKFK